MRVAVFSTKPYDVAFLTDANADAHELVCFEARLGPETTALAQGCGAVCVFVNDCVNADVAAALARQGVTLIALRCAGFNNVDLAAAASHGLTVVRVPAYSPHAVAEHTLALMLSLNRHIHRAYARVREGNFALDGLMGFDLAGRTAGVVGTGRIGAVVVHLLRGFGCRVFTHDIVPNPNCMADGAEYVPLDRLFRESDLVTLHCPLAPNTYHLINRDVLSIMKPGVMLINTSRGALVDAAAAIDALKSGRLGSLGLDVYEEEADMFFEDLSNRVLQDDIFARLLTFPNVLVTGHQAFLTRDALTAIAVTTMGNIDAYVRGDDLPNALCRPTAPCSTAEDSGPDLGPRLGPSSGAA
jgi:D-lactate dehydrogenase